MCRVCIKRLVPPLSGLLQAFPPKLTPVLDSTRSRHVGKLKQTEECFESSTVSKRLHSSEDQPMRALLTAALCMLGWNILTSRILHTSPINPKIGEASTQFKIYSYWLITIAKCMLLVMLWNSPAFELIYNYKLYWLMIELYMMHDITFWFCSILATAYRGCVCVCACMRMYHYELTNTCDMVYWQPYSPVSTSHRELTLHTTYGLH